MVSLEEVQDFSAEVNRMLERKAWPASLQRMTFAFGSR